MHITMVKKTGSDGADCRKCAEVTEHLQARGLWERVDEVVWASEGDPTSPGILLGEKFGVDRAPFFIVRDEQGETVYTSVLQLVRERLGQAVSARQQLQDIDVDDVGGI